MKLAGPLDSLSHCSHQVKYGLAPQVHSALLCSGHVVCRMVAFDEATVLSDGCARSAGQIMCFQLGSRLLGPVATEDLDRGNAYFDVFAIADLASLAVKAQAAVAAAPQHGKRLRVEHTVNQIAKMPRSYSTNSPAEERLEEYLREYAVVFTELYRHRRPLYFMPQNECCVKKCVCTTVCTFIAADSFSPLASTLQFL